MNKITVGLVAGLIATVVLSAMMLVKGMMGVMPELDVIAMLSSMMGASAAVGWLGHFIIGTVIWGGGFALLYGLIPGGTALVKGIVFGIAAWLGMMIMVMPTAGAGLFGMGFGIMAPIMTLVLHFIYGAVLGMVFRMLVAPKPAYLNKARSGTAAMTAALTLNRRHAMHSEKISFPGANGATLPELTPAISWWCRSTRSSARVCREPRRRFRTASTRSASTPAFSRSCGPSTSWRG